jgi:hypothetical protein
VPLPALAEALQCALVEVRADAERGGGDAALPHRAGEPRQLLRVGLAHVRLAVGDEQAPADGDTREVGRHLCAASFPPARQVRRAARVDLRQSPQGPLRLRAAERRRHDHIHHIVEHDQREPVRQLEQSERVLDGHPRQRDLLPAHRP